MDNIIQLSGINNCFIYLDADYIYAVCEMDEDYIVEDGEKLRIPAHTRIFTTHGHFRVQDKILDVMSKINKVNNQY